jgi:dehydrogenase/reductase SDR family member 12
VVEVVGSTDATTTPGVRNEIGRAAGRVVDSVLDFSLVGYTRWGLRIRSRLPGWPADPPAAALAGHTALVTGANSGLGKATTAGLARLGARVHLVVRNVEKGDQAREELAADLPDAELRVWRCDLSDLDDVARFAAEFTAAESRLDVLIHNAGLLPAERQTSAQDHELTLATHVLGPLLLTESLRPVLAAAGRSRVIFVTSGGMYTQRLPADDLEYRLGRYSGSAAYARTKRVQVALLPVLAQRWLGDGIAVHAMHPGWADTPGVASSLPGFHRLTGPALRNLDEGADTTVWLAGSVPAPPSGLLWHERRPRAVHRLPWTRHSEAERRKVWRQCAAAVGIEP